ncbi:hypothetical protein EVAR_52320_1 [Eumeta japonica]|uniref:Uncharacterized protein n=1 Tax=Eumeta variegata TaxID=151549 RepID=A0A4C1Y247_EUMVA|nr:hypothetical protein EVAR_52320_1 [Eumeta japonica]
MKRNNPKVPTDPKTAPMRAQKGEVDPPAPFPVKQLRDYYANAFSEFIALTSATLKVRKATCDGILRMHLSKSETRLTAALENAGAAVYDNTLKQY